MRRTSILLAGVVVLLLGPLLFLQSTRAEDYIIGSGDVLRITVYEHPDLTTIVRVGAVGNITFPFIGELEVKNLSTSQIEKAIANKLSGEFIKDPQVNVFVEQYRGQKITVMGEVVKAGQYEIMGPTYVIDAISMALGMTKDAGESIILLKRHTSTEGTSSYVKVVIDPDKLFKEGDLSENLPLRDQDILYVPKVDLFYIFGEVNRPGVYRIEKHLTVKRAVASAGGFTPKAAKKRIEITKYLDGKDKVIDGTLDSLVEPDDVIKIEESLF